MVFSSIHFIFFFLPGVLLVYYGLYFLLRSKTQRLFTVLNLTLLITSLIFYIKGEKKFFWVMLFVGLIDYWVALAIEANRRSTQPSHQKQKSFLYLSIASNMGLLFYFKYSKFTFEILEAGASSPVLQALYPFLSLTLPVGISFYTFESMSYIIDVYRGHFRATRRFIDYWAFITFFPHLIAGPIIRYADLKSQLEKRQHNWQNLHEGFYRFSLGLAKKVIIANPLGYYADILFLLDTQKMDTLTAWLAAITYTLQIYFDFSGYSDMAIGLARLFGVTLPENFNQPYISQSIKEFWRRWHMTLSGWFRDYLYIPLGGNREGVFKEYRNLLLVFILCGLWHGANLTFLAWGIFHGVFLVIERLAAPYTPPFPRWIKHIYTLILIVCSWVLFRSDSISQSWAIYKAMLGQSISLISPDSVRLLTHPRFFVYAFLGVSVCILAPFGYFKSSDCRSQQVFAFALFLISVILLCGQEYNPFIYFRF